MAKDNNIWDELEELERRYFDQTIEIKREGKTEFTNDSELVTFAAVCFAKLYREHLMYWKSTAMDDREEYAMWNSKLQKEIKPMYEAFKIAIWRHYQIERKSLLARIGLKHCDRIIVDTNKHTEVYDYALRITENTLSPKNIFPNNVRYVIDLSEMTLSREFQKA